MLDPILQIVKFQANVGDQRLAISKEHAERLLRKAKIVSATDVQATAHNFTGWVFGLEHSYPLGTVAQRQSFLNQARRKVSDVLDRFADGRVGSWELLSCDDGTRESIVYETSVLTVAGRPLRLKPDAVFRDKRTGTIVIFEYKIPTPGVQIPLHGWPNVAVQLWAYAWANPWANSSNVLLVGVNFCWNGIEAELGSIFPRTAKLDSELSRSSIALFKAWGGTVNPLAVSSKELRRILTSRK